MSTNVAMSNWAEDEILDMMLRNSNKTPPATVYMSLATALTGDDTVTEIADGNYARQSMSFGAASSGAASIDADITFPAANAQYTYRYVGVHDASTSGNLIYHYDRGSVETVDTGKQVEFASGAFTVTQAGDAHEANVLDMILDFWLNNTDYSQVATVYSALFTAYTNPTTLTECTDSGYARLATAFDAAVNGATANTAIERFGVVAVQYTVNGIGLYDALTTGNLLFAKTHASTVMNVSEQFQMAAGDFDITLG